MTDPGLPVRVTSLLTNVVRNAGSLYQPLLLERMPSGGDLRRVLSEISSAEGATLTQEISAVSGLALGEKGVLLLSHGQLRDLSQGSVLAVPPHCQVIVWSNGPIRDIPTDLHPWVEGGLRYRLPSEGLGEAYETFSSSVTKCLERPGRMFNPLVIVCPEAEAERIGLDVGIRFNAVCERGIEHLDHTFSVDHWGERRHPPPGMGLVVRLGADTESDAAVADLIHALEQAISVPAQVALILSPTTHAELERSPLWRPLLQRGMVIQASAIVKPRRPRIPGELPPLNAVLAGRPPRGKRRQVLLSGSVGTISLGDALQFVATSANTGRLVLYQPERIGLIDFRAGTIVHASIADAWPRVSDIAQSRAGDSGGVPGLAEEVAETRILEMAGWADARFAFVRNTEIDPPLDEEVLLSPQSVMMTIAHHHDEIPGVERRTGGDRGVWKALAGRGTAPEDGLPLRLLDGVTPSGEIRRVCGLSRLAMAQKLAALAADGAIERCADALDDSPEPGSSLRVVSTLWGEGLVDTAMDLLYENEKSNRADPGLIWFRAWLHAEREEWDESAAAFLACIENQEDSSRLLSATLNFALIMARTDSLSPEDAQERIGAAGVLTMVLEGRVPELAAGACEIAARAGNHDLAVRLSEKIPGINLRGAYSRAIDLI